MEKKSASPIRVLTPVPRLGEPQVHFRCGISGMCIFSEACSGQSPNQTQLGSTHRRVRRGSMLFRNGDPFRSLFSVRSGVFKTVALTQDGREQVLGFHMNGDVIGLDGMAGSYYVNDAIALENAEVCVLPIDAIRLAASRLPGLDEQLHHILAQEIVREHRVMLMLGSMSAEERVAAFLVDLMERLHAGGWSGTEAILRMTRQEIGSFLGLTLETVSRALSALATRGLIQIKVRHIKVLDPEGLRRVAPSTAPSGATRSSPLHVVPAADRPQDPNPASGS